MCNYVCDRQARMKLLFSILPLPMGGAKNDGGCCEKDGENVFVPLTVGGGISTIEDFRTILRAGADKISVNLGGP